MTLGELRDLIDKRIRQRPDMAAMDVIVRASSSWASPDDYRPDGGLYMDPADGETVAVLTVRD